MSDSDVSRETSDPPVVAAAVFGEHLAVAGSYWSLLATAGVERGLIGPREVPRLWERHLLNCAVVVTGIPDRAAVCDVGTGAGLPGIVWALLRPDLEMTLLEPLARRVEFLQEAVSELGLTNTSVVRARAEDLAGVRVFDVVTSRAVAPLDKLLRWSMPLVDRGGCVMALKGQSAEEEAALVRPKIHRLGGRSVTVEEYGAHLLDIPTRVVRVPLRGKEN